MSEFDKEAEREKLREKYGDEDDEDREATQRMSQLLLKGATMTNHHCDTCGDPIFRQNGSEFCPTCHSEAQAAAETGSQSDATESPDAAAEASAPAQADRSAAAQVPENAEAQTASSPASLVRQDAGEQSASGRDSQERRDVGDVRSPTPASQSPDAAATPEDAEAALTSALTRFARAAAATDDPRRAQDHLAAAREAAEALDALRR
jgi:uncharacterized Zn finger protein (UPF0148 family)